MVKLPIINEYQGLNPSINHEDGFLRISVLLIHLHNLTWVPMNGVVVEISSWIEPRIELLLFVSYTLDIDICMDNVRLSGYVTQELKVYLVMPASCRGHLQNAQKMSVHGMQL